MKKLLLAGFVVVAFLLYSYHQRNETAPPVIAPATASGNTTNSSGTNTMPAGGMNGTPMAAAGYKDGTYTGSVANAFYGNVQVQVTVQGGRITDVSFLQYPNDNGTSRMINSQATPYLKQEAISAQSANVNVVTGATDTSMAFVQSLTAALSHAS